MTGGWRRWRHRALLALVVLYSLFPLYFVTVQSLKTAREDVFGNPLWVRAPTLENYAELFEGAGAAVRGYVIVPRVPFLLWLANSAVVLLGTIVLTLGAGVPAGWAMGRLRPPGWRFWRRALFASYVVPHTILFLPLYRIVIGLGLDDSRGSLVLIYTTMTLPFAVWLLSAYYGHLPPDVEESALVEGATPAAAFWHIVLPMSRNVLVAVALFALGTAANDFVLASIFLTAPAHQTVAAGLGVMDVSLEELVPIAGVNLAAIPIVVACALFARTYVRGLTAAMLEGS